MVISLLCVGSPDRRCGSLEAVFGVGKECIRPPSRAVLKALILLHFQRVLFLHIGPVFPGPCSLVPFGTFCCTGGAVECVVPGRGKCPSTLPTAPLPDGGWREQRGAQASVQGKAVSAVIVVALMHQPPGRSVLLIGHVRDFGYNHFTRSPGKILKTLDLRFYRERQSGTDDT